jgi:hypothetical protein
MNLNEPSTSIRIVLKTVILLFFIICLPGLVQAQWEPTYPGSNDIRNTNPGNIGIGTPTPQANLDVSGDFKWRDVRYYRISRTFGTGTNDWVEIGSFANNTTSQYMLFTVQGHWCGGIISAQFRYDDVGYTGTSSNWMELPAMGGKIYQATQPVAIDVKRANPGSLTDPILARVRNLYGMCGGTSLAINIESNAIYTATTNTGSTGTVDAGYAASNLGWKFPVTTDAHSASTNGLFVLNTGNVGIGTSTPSAGTKLQVVDATDTSIVGSYSGTRAGGNGVRFRTLDGAEQFMGELQFTSDGASNNASTAKLSIGNGVGGSLTAMTVLSGGSVGIGTTGPTNKLSIYGNSGNTIADIDAPTPAAAILQFRKSSVDKGRLYVNASDVTILESSIGNNTIALSGGNVGIGKTDPAYKLEVEGAIHANGAITGTTINATYQDVAEWVPSSQKLSAGTVVVLDTAKSNHVLASISSYDTKVAGVISAQPGIALGTGSDDKVLVATTGRVKVKVDATSAPIHVGDLLVTSDNEGVAMKSEPIVISGRKMHAPGTIVGKALEPLEKGTGEILVLLSLQ